MHEKKRKSVTIGSECGNKRNLLGAFDALFRRKSHEDAVGENGDDDEKTEKRMHQHVDGDAANRMERVQDPKRLGGTKAKNVFALADHIESLPCRFCACKKGVNNKIGVSLECTGCLAQSGGRALHTWQ